MIQINAPYLDQKDRPIDLKTLKFPGGEVHVKIDAGRTTGNLVIRAHLPNSDAVMELLMVTDALRRAYPYSPIHLEMPYVPYARQDRVANSGEAHSIKVFCGLINAQGYETVTIQDPHSDVTTALLDRVTVEDLRPSLRTIITKIMEQNADSVMTDGTRVTLISPDAGARKRVHALAQYFVSDVVHADKKRDTATGNITGTVIQDEMPVAPMLIVDDICDGGRTFVEIAKAIRAKEKDAGITNGLNRPLYLYVTHGIFSKGLAELYLHFEGVFTSNRWIDDSAAIVV